MTNILASSLGTLAANVGGLAKLVLPRSLPGSFRSDVVASAKSLGCHALSIGNGPGEYSPQQAIQFRTPETSSVLSILLVMSEADARELKSLEAFRGVLSNGLPGGLFEENISPIQLASLCANICASCSSGSIDAKKQSDALFQVCSFIGTAYKEYGNEIEDWTSSFWLHFDMLANALPAAQKVVVPDHKDAAIHAAYLAAGLPCPNNGAAYEAGRSAKKYATLVAENWSTATAIERSLVDAELIGNRSPHPARKLRWETFASTKANYGHTLLAFSRHGHSINDRTTWLNAWKSFTEEEFFGVALEEDIEVSVDIKSNGQDFVEVRTISGDKNEDIFVLAPPDNKLDADGRLEIANLRINIRVPSSVTTKEVALSAEITPKMASLANVRSVTPTRTGFAVEVDLSRTFKRDGKWPEKPITLFLKPRHISTDNAINDTIKLKFLLCNPARPTVLAVERAKKEKLLFASQSILIRDQEGQRLVPDFTEGDVPQISFQGVNTDKTLVCLGDFQTVQWEDGLGLEQALPVTTFPEAGYYQLKAIPESSIVNVNGFKLVIGVPAIESGKIAPIAAAISGQDILPISGDIQEELSPDPRFTLEEWLRDNSVVSSPANPFKKCLGSVLLSIDPARSTGKINWNEGVGAFSDFSVNTTAKFPVDPASSSTFDSFWSSFNALSLQECASDHLTSALPSALDLRKLDKGKVEAYLAAYLGLLQEIDPTKRNQSWLAYPLSAVLFNPTKGQHVGVLLSPLHPLRLAWSWSAQNAAEDLAKDDVFSSVANSFLRFVDGDSLPLLGPSLNRPSIDLALSLAPGPHEFFCGWSMLAPSDLHNNLDKRSISVLKAYLPLGAPSGLDRGGVSAAIRDYMRVFPFTPQMRIGLSSSGGLQRYVETDEAVVSAVTELVQGARTAVPGGVRILDSKSRKGNPPNATRVLREINSNLNESDTGDIVPPFEWLVDDGDRSVDVRFLEDAPIQIFVKQSDDVTSLPRSAGPSTPISRFRNWVRNLSNPGLSVSLNTLTSGSYSGLQGFSDAIGKLETLPWQGSGTEISTELSLGGDLTTGSARWTVTGNRHLNPASLSAQLQADQQAGLSLWEWRPAFLSRSEQKGATSSICSSQPYTVLARTPPGLLNEISQRLESCDVPSKTLGALEIIECLGTRGVGLASLLTMGHSQSMGAIGFYLAFKALEHWEEQCGQDEVRCIVPMDSIYALIDVLAVNSKELDGQRRADLLLVKARVNSNGNATLWLHPLEIKARSESVERFPQSGGKVMEDPVEQLANTKDAIIALKRNLETSGGKLDLVNASLATLLEAGFAMNPASTINGADVEISVLEAAARGKIDILATPGSLFWFQPGARGLGGLPYERRPGNANAAGHLVSTLIAAAQSVSGDEYSSAVTLLVESSMGKEPPQVHAPGPEGPSGEDDDGFDGPPSDKSGPETDVQKSDDDVCLAEQVEVGSTIVPETVSTGENPNESADRQSPQAQARQGINILVGTEHRAGQSRDVFLRPSDTALSQLNIGVVGDLGTGKTQFLKSFVYQLSMSAPFNRGHRPKTFVFDYKQDYSSGDFPESINATVLDPTRTLPLNFFALGRDASRVDKVRRATFFADMLKRISSIGMVQRQNLYQSVMRAYSACPPGHWPMLTDIFEFYREESGGKADSVVSVLTLITDLRIFEASPENVASFRELYTGDTVLNLSTMGAGQDIVDILATMFLDFLYHDYMKHVPKAEFVTGDDGVSRRQVDSFILIDEAHHAMGRGFDVLMKLMLEGREFGLGVILSSQFLSHFQTGGRDWAEALSTWVVHNVRNAMPKDFDRIGFRGNTKALAKDISSLKTHWAYYRCTNGENEGILLKGQPYFSLVKDT